VDGESIKGRWERTLAADMRALEQEHETNVLVSLMEDHEYHGYQIPELLEKDRFGGIEILRFAIEDMGVPRAGGATVSFRSYLDVTGQHEARNESSLRRCSLGDGVDGIGHASRKPPAHGERY
jgi:hypothetical protein